MTTTSTDPKLRRDLKTLARFIGLYCRDHHADRPRSPATLKTHDVAEIAGREIQLCDDCGHRTDAYAGPERFSTRA